MRNRILKTICNIYLNNVKNHIYPQFVKVEELKKINIGEWQEVRSVLNNLFTEKIITARSSVNGKNDLIEIIDFETFKENYNDSTL